MVALEQQLLPAAHHCGRRVGGMGGLSAPLLPPQPLSTAQASPCLAQCPSCPRGMYGWDGAPALLLVQGWADVTSRPLPQCPPAWAWRSWLPTPSLP